MGNKQGRKARLKRRERREKERRSKKEQNKALYESYRDSGKNQKVKGRKAKAKPGQGYHRGSHPCGPCGNIGCVRCFPDIYRQC